MTVTSSPAGLAAGEEAGNPSKPAKPAKPVKPTKPARPASMMIPSSTEPALGDADSLPELNEAGDVASEPSGAFDLSDLDALESELSSFLSEPEPAPSSGTSSSLMDTLDPRFLNEYNTLMDLKLKTQTIVMDLSASTWSASDANALRSSLRSLGDTGKALSSSMPDQAPLFQNDLVNVIKTGMGVLQTISSGATVSGADLSAVGDVLLSSVGSGFSGWCTSHARQ